VKRRLQHHRKHLLPLQTRPERFAALRAVAFQAEQVAVAGQLSRLGELLAAMEGEYERAKVVLEAAEWP
jgi:hypothetical protein